MEQRASGKKKVYQSMIKQVGYNVRWFAEIFSFLHVNKFSSKSQKVKKSNFKMAI